jgi:hypothetical protein
VRKPTATLRGLVCVLSAAAVLGNGCSILIDSHARKVAAQRQKDADAILQKGTARSAVVDKLGDPDQTQTANGLRTDSYFLRSIPDPSASSSRKWEKVDLMFLLLPEIVMTPAVIYGDYFSTSGNKLCRISYGRDDHIEQTDCQVIPDD